MIQILWLFDFLGLLGLRTILAAILLFEAFSLRSRNKFLGFLKLILGVSIFLGYLTSFAGIFLIVSEILEFLIWRKDLKEHLLKIALGLVLIFIGPGWFSFDRFFNLRW